MLKETQSQAFSDTSRCDNKFRGKQLSVTFSGGAVIIEIPPNPSFPASGHNMVRFLPALVLCAFVSTLRADEKADFFEAKIRPVLVEQCQSCHSTEAAQNKKLQGGLLLDSREGLLQGGDSGPALVPGKPKQSLLLQTIHYDGDIQMPPKGKLAANIVADFEKWIADGAVDPRSSTATEKKGIDLAKGREAWAFQPPQEHAPPKITATTVPIRKDIDAFIQAKWMEKKLTPAPLADKRTLIRRVTFDLIGLPPTPEAVEEFLNDNSPEAFAKVVDRLLASPQYGERYARMWLDVARYAEDQAHTFGNKPKKNAYRYRDWVIEAFNTDMPYDQFVMLQIAGDQLNTPELTPFTKLAGLGFLGLGAEYYKNTAREQAIADELDDRVDTLTRGFLGLTVSCARCHDHKFDPIPQIDYYSIAGIFNGSNLTEAQLGTPAEIKEFADAMKVVKVQEDEIKSLLNSAMKKAAIEAAPKATQYISAAKKISEVSGDEAKTLTDEFVKRDGLNRVFLDRWVKTLPKFASGKSVLKSLNDQNTDELMKSIDEAAKAYAAGKPAKEHAALIAELFTDPKAPFVVEDAEIEKSLMTETEDKTKLAEMRSEAERRKKELPPAPPTAHVLSGGGTGMKLFIRGNPLNKGEQAPKGFLQVLTKAPSATKDYTRLDLANTIAAKDNPLTARVIVNRIWQAHFGRGLVFTPSNFGKLGDPPSHPELLDTLAAKFMANGWSMKWLHREIVNSSTYQLASSGNSSTDPANVYLWRADRRRLDVEAWRDSLLSVAGNLDETVGGPTFDLKDAAIRRRTVYAKVSRHDLNGLLRLFDFPDANVTADKRTETTVPQQQLFALNSEFMTNQARAFAERIAKSAPTDDERVAFAYRVAFNRPPTEREKELALAFVQATPAQEEKLTRWQQYAQVLLASNEMMYVD